MEKKVEAYIRKNDMLKQKSRVIAAVSGGADSVCLLHMLVSLRERFDLSIQAIHVHHGLRGAEADRDAQFVRELSEKWEVPCLVVCRDVAAYARENGLGVEEAGRELRYSVFEKAAGEWGGARIAVAHHQDDQAETILHNLFRGSGLRGLGGMTPVRGNVIRPLLCVTRQEIVDYLDGQDISYCQDSTNNSVAYTRNKLRHRIIPMVCQEVNFKAVPHIVAAGERIRQAEEYFEREAGRIWNDEKQVERIEKDGCRRCGIRAGAMEKLPDIVKGYVAMEMIKELTERCRDIASIHVESILELTEKGTGTSCSLPYGLRAYREYDMVWLETGGGQGNRQENIHLGLGSFDAEYVSAHIFREKYKEIPEKKYTKWFDCDKIKGTLSVRTRETGDYITLKYGRKKTVKAFMIDAKIPRPERDQILLLAEGHHVLWIVGYRISEFYKITDETKHILQVKTDGGKEHGG